MAKASSRDRAEIASGKASARDKREAGVKVKGHKRSKPGRKNRKSVKVKNHRRRKPRR